MKQQTKSAFYVVLLFEMHILIWVVSLYLFLRENKLW